MNIVHAVWEHRNLGCDAWEIGLSLSDFSNWKAVTAELQKDVYRDAYVVVKMPSGNLAVLHELEDLLFRFVETQLEIICDLARCHVCASLFKRMEDYLVCERSEVGAAAWDDVITKMSGDMFVSDRIYLDKAFLPGTSAKRYRNWMQDMRNDCTKELILRRPAVGGDPVSFDVICARGSDAVGVLGGVYPTKAMLGIPHILSLFKYLRARGFKRFVTHISSNNLPMMRVYANVGGTVCDAQYVLRRLPFALQRKEHAC